VSPPENYRSNSIVFALSAHACSGKQLRLFLHGHHKNKFDTESFALQSPIMHNDDWATENLKVIRTLMESSAIYRHALAPVMSVVGITGVAAGMLGGYLNFETSRYFAAYWIAVALVCLTEAFLMIRSQAMKALEPFWSPPTRRVAQAVTPAFFAGLAAGVVFFMMDITDQQRVLLLVPIWMVLYGLAVHAAGFFMPRSFRAFAWEFIWFGLVFLGWLISLFRPASTVVLPDFPVANAAMAILFGGGHVAYGIYLYFTEKRGNVV